MIDPFETPERSKFYEDQKLYAALAYRPLTEGHSVVVWKPGSEDISELSKDDYEYLMDAVEVARNTLKKFYGVEKVYLMYWDETRFVHWHLVPRYNQKGVNALAHDPEKINKFPDTHHLSRLHKEARNEFHD